MSHHLEDVAGAGLAVALTDRERLLHVTTAGYADLAAKKPITPETYFEVGSIGKSFTAIALLQEHAVGRLDLHAPITEYLPWFSIQSNFAPITVHHVLSHTAGLPRGTDGSPSAPYEVVALRECVAGSPPGERFYYSNVGYKLLGLLLEAVSGQRYADRLQQGILDPLGMTECDPVTTHETRKRLAVGYEPFYDDRPAHRSYPLAPATWFEYGMGDGSPACTAANLAAYLRMLMNEGRAPGGRILSDKSFALLTQRAIPAMGQLGDLYYGYGLVHGTRSDLDGHQSIGHGGATVGYRATMLADVDAGLGVTVLANYSDNVGPVAVYALQLITAERASRQLPPSPPLVDPTRVDNAADYVGTYRADDEALVVEARGNRLFLHHRSQEVPLEQRGGDRFFAPHPAFALFNIGFSRTDGQVDELSHGSRWYIHGRYTGPTEFAAPDELIPYVGHYRSHNPWFSNFRVVPRKGALWLTMDYGEEPLIPLGGGLFRVGAEEHSPERLSFDTFIGDKALRARWAGGGDYYRVWTP
jgi:D-alanyl-D-alanine carboxypeptidase